MLLRSVSGVLASGVIGALLLGCGEVAPESTAMPERTGWAAASSPPAHPASTAAVITATTPTASPVATPASTPVSQVQPATPTPAPAGVAMPDSRLTPGEVFAGVSVSQICTPGYSSSARHVEHQQYVDVYAAYGVRYPEPSGTYELDHLIPLELGGDNADANLWPEPAAPAPGFHQKDELENRMHDLVCSGQLALAEAQREIASNWYAAYQRYVGG